MNLADALGYLKKVKMLAFRDEELGIPLPVTPLDQPPKDWGTAPARYQLCDVPPPRHSRQHPAAEVGGIGLMASEKKEAGAEIPLEENFGEYLESGGESPYERLLLSEFPYSARGAFAFSALSAELSRAFRPMRKQGGGGKTIRFGKKRNADFAGIIENFGSGKNIPELFKTLPERINAWRQLETKFLVHCDAKTASCFMKLAAGWKKMFSIPYRENVWPVRTKKFVAAYALGWSVYGEGEFHPSFGNLISAAAPDAEYGWIEEEMDAGALGKEADEVAKIHAQAFDSDAAPRFSEFLVLSALLGNAQIAEIGERRMHAPEFFANVPYMLAKAENERANGNLSEALFLLRTVADLSLLALRAAPLGGRMLALTKYFDACENIVPKRFTLEKNAGQFLGKHGADFENPEKGPIALKSGSGWHMENGKISAGFGTVLGILKAPHFLSRGSAETGGNAFWKTLRSANAALFLASYERGSPLLSLLEEGSMVRRGADLLKVEQFGSKTVVKRAMAYESGKAKEIKAHLARIIEIADARSLDENKCIGEMGSWGEAVYESANANGRGLLALVSSKRFY